MNIKSKKHKNNFYKVALRNSPCYSICNVSTVFPILIKFDGILYLVV